MKHYVKFIKKFHLPLIALTLIGLIYFGVNGVKAEFKNSQREYKTIDTLVDRPLNIVAVDDTQAQNVVSPSPSSNNETKSEKSPEVKNIPAAKNNATTEKVTMRVNAGSAAGNYPFEFIPSENAYQLLMRMANKNNIPVQAKDYGWGMFVEAIGNLTNGKDTSWFLYINGISSEVGASDYQVKPNDLIEWRYHEYWTY